MSGAEVSGAEMAGSEMPGNNEAPAGFIMSPPPPAEESGTPVDDSGANCEQSKQSNSLFLGLILIALLYLKRRKLFIV